MQEIQDLVPYFEDLQAARSTLESQVQELEEKKQAMQETLAKLHTKRLQKKYEHMTETNVTSVAGGDDIMHRTVDDLSATAVFLAERER